MLWVFIATCKEWGEDQWLNYAYIVVAMSGSSGGKTAHAKLWSCHCYEQ